MIHNSKFLILAVVGPTASGKSELAVQLAKKFNGEIISCDSRQIYKGMNLGTGKIEGKWMASFFRGREKSSPCYIYKGIRHHLIDFVNPQKQYSASLFQAEAKKTIADIIARGKLPILCGGTAHWVDAVVYNQEIPDVKPNPKLRAQLGKKSADDLYKQLKKLDPNRAKTIERHNPHRLIRALEIVITTGKPVPALPLFYKEGAGGSYFNALWLGIKPPDDVLATKIKKRLAQRLKQGVAKEVAKLHREGLSWKRLESFGLEYKFVSLYLQKKLSYDEMFELLFTAIKQYSKRQMTWWKRNKEIKWVIKPTQAINITKKFIS